MNRFSLGLYLSLLGTITSVQAEDRNQMVHGDQQTFSARSEWVYNDIEKGMAEAKRSKRPLLVVFR